MNFLDPPVSYEFLGFGKINVPKNTAARMRDIIRESAKNEYVRKWAEHIVENVPDRDKWGEINAIYRFIQSNVRYANDPRGIEYVQTPPYVLNQIKLGMKPSLDCFANDQKIIVKHVAKNRYELKDVGSLGDCYKEYQALSYDFNETKFVFKNITRWLDKGKKEVFEVKLKNGNKFKVTKDHDIIHLIKNEHVTKCRVEKTQLKNIMDCANILFPVAKKIPTPEKQKYSFGQEIFPNVTCVKVKSIKSVGYENTCDLTVEDTHNVVLSHGLIIGQCDDHVVLGLSLARSLGYTTMIRVTGYKDDGTFSHVYGMISINSKWVPFDAIRKDWELGFEGPGKRRVMDLIV